MALYRRVIGDPRHEVGGRRGFRTGGVRRALAAALHTGLRLALRHPPAPARAPPRATLALSAGKWNNE